MITWGDIIEITVFLFDTTQAKLEKQLNYSKGVVSKIKHGKQTPSASSKEFFSCVFDPNTPDSPAHKCKGTPKSYLESLKEEIAANFVEVRKDMDDCWNENDYQQFVLILLGRAKKGISSKKKNQQSKGSEGIPSVSEKGNDKVSHKQQKKVPPSGPPSEQMSKIFEQAIADYSIATYVCRLPDYLMGEPFYASDSFAFVDAVQNDILTKFTNHQDEEIYNKISQFANAVKTYAGVLGMIRLSVSEEYGFMLKGCGFTTEIFDEIDVACDAIKSSLDNKLSQADKSSNPSTDDSEGKLIQLDFIRSILLAHKQLCKLYREIYPGRTLLLF